MGEGKFRADINRAEKLCRELEFFRDRRSFPGYKDSDTPHLRRLPYIDQWNWYTEKGQFDLMLPDLALLQFRRGLDEDKNVALSYSYLPCPYAVESYEEFLIRFGTSYAEARDLFWDDYSVHVLTCSAKRHITPIRYDYAPRQYTQGLHPLAHVHVGIDNHIRLAAERSWRPTSFVLFVLRQGYPSQWQRFHEHQDAPSHVKAVRDELQQHKPKHWAERDFWEAYLR